MLVCGIPVLDQQFLRPLIDVLAESLSLGVDIPRLQDHSFPQRVMAFDVEIVFGCEVDRFSLRVCVTTTWQEQNLETAL